MGTAGSRMGSQVRGTTFVMVAEAYARDFPYQRASWVGPRGGGSKEGLGAEEC